MTSETPQPPVLRVVSGDPAPEHLAALVAVFSAMGVMPTQWVVSAGNAVIAAASGSSVIPACGVTNRSASSALRVT